MLWFNTLLSTFTYVYILSPLFVSQEAASEKGILEQSEITLVSLTDTTLPDQETTITDEEGPWEEKHPDGVTEEGQKGQETEVTVQLCKRHFIYFMTQDHDHMVWSTNKTYNNNKTMVHSKTQEMLLKQGRKFFKKAPSFQITFGFSDCNNTIKHRWVTIILGQIPFS